MSLQIILRTPADIGLLPLDTSAIETFPVPDGMLGVTIPTKIVDSVGQQKITPALSQIEHFDLWAAQWNIPK
jgi:hypothetical protein